MFAVEPPDPPRFRAGLDRLPAACAAGGRGWCAAAACILEATAAKPGNVHPGASFPDLDCDELCAAAVAIAPVIEAAPSTRLGLTVRRAVEASRGLTRSNANLGIVLAMAPLAAADGGDEEAVFARLDAADAADVWAAIAAAAPGGLGTAPVDDLAGEPPRDLRDAMRRAAAWDRIAALWADGYAPLRRGLVADLERELDAGATPADAIVRGFLRQLAREPDTLVARRHGDEVAADVSRRAGEVLAAGPRWRDAAAAFDGTLRRPRRINPGTTADLVATALYILLRERGLARLLGAGSA